jgi:hypothetical protein
VEASNLTHIILFIWIVRVQKLLYIIHKMSRNCICINDIDCHVANVHPPVFKAVLLLPCLANKAVSTVCLEELLGLVFRVDDNLIFTV